MDTELEDFKSRIDLREYAASQGYALDRRESSRTSSVMRKGPDKIVVKRGPDNHYVYFSIRDDADNGSIIDFVQRRQRGISLGVVRKELRPWIGRPASALPLFSALDRSAKDRARVERDYSAMQLAARHPYLEKRGIPPALLAAPRFVGRIRIDARGNAVFPHFDAKGLCGFEKKNNGFTGFAGGGEKGLWESHELEGDHGLVLAESAIDALSHAALFPDSQLRYASLGGEVNPQQPELIQAAIQSLPEGSTVIAAMDADAVGRKLAAMVASTVKDSRRPDLAFRAHLPEAEGTDWNDRLQNFRPLPFPTALLKSPSAG